MFFAHIGPVAEQVLLLENISTSVLVGPDQLPHIHTLMVEAAHMLQMEPPDLYIRQNPVPNAYTLAISGRKPFVVVHTALLELLTPSELQTVLAHELGHLKCDHGLWLTAANVLAMGTVSLLPIISSMWQESVCPLVPNLQTSLLCINTRCCGGHAASVAAFSRANVRPCSAVGCAESQDCGECPHEAGWWVAQHRQRLVGGCVFEAGEVI